ncbi:MAG TPA: glycolate oxidase subunit GlcF [Azonexus sp.]
MDTRLADFIRDTQAGKVAEEILRKCVHCGFCTATCPTYQLLGDELDGPRGRIYLIKQVLEGKEPSAKTRLHLDRCLTCRACETTCPSGVEYGHLLDVGRAVIESRVPRPLGEALPRALLKAVVPRPQLFSLAVGIGRAMRPLLPGSLADKLPPQPATAGPWPAPRGLARRMLVLAGCVQPALAPNINAATARLLDRLGIELFTETKAGCCGAVRHHLSDAAARDDMRRNIDAWWPHVEAAAGPAVEAIVVTASGCGVQVRDYGHILADDPDYAGKAARISALCRDPAEIVAAEGERLRPLLKPAARGRLAFHSPCTLQHGLKIRGVVETLLTAAGYELTPVADSHLCCGSAGSYALLQPELAQRLRRNKLSALHAGGPALVATANIGCLVHLQAGSLLPVRHWIELLDEATA